MEQAIDRGSLERLFEPGCTLQPVLQVVQMKKMDKKDDSQPDRYRVVLSDIDHFVQSMLATQANWTVTEGGLDKGCAVRLKHYQPQVVKGKKILIVPEIEVLTEYGFCDKIGQPTGLETIPEGQPAAISGNNFYGNQPAPQQPQQPQQAQQNRSQPARTSNNGSTANLYPIEGLSPYAHKWTIKVRCTHKSEIKTWHKQSGEGKLFSVNFLDETGEIRATGFNAECDALYDVFQEGSVYFVSSPCRIQLAKKQFSNVNNDYEMTFERDTVVEKVEDTDTSVPQVRYNFTPIGSLQSIETNSTIDAIGILKGIDEVSQIVSKTTSKPYDKRELTLVDDTMTSVRLTIWGNTATNFDAPLESVIAFKGLKVSDFGGRSLSLLSSGSFQLDPDIDDAHKLKGWYDAQGRNDNFAAQSTTGAASGRKDPYKTIEEVKDEGLGMGEQTDYFTLKATILYVKQDNFAYPACQTEACNKKVVEIDPGQWRCEKCEKNWEKPLWRYIMTVNVGDHTGQLWLNIFNDIGEIVMGSSADRVQELKENGEERDIFEEANCKSYVFRCRAKMDTFQDQSRVRYHAQRAENLNFVQESRRLADIMKQYNTDSDSLFV